MALKKKKMPFSPDLVICDGEYTIECGERWGKTLIRDRKVDGIFCANDLLAIGAIKAAKELGAKKAELVRYQTSGDTTGDYSSVVGYAGIIIKGE